MPSQRTRVHVSSHATFESMWQRLMTLSAGDTRTTYHDYVMNDDNRHRPHQIWRTTVGTLQEEAVRTLQEEEEVMPNEHVHFEIISPAPPDPYAFDAWLMEGEAPTRVTMTAFTAPTVSRSIPIMDATPSPRYRDCWDCLQSLREDDMVQLDIVDTGPVWLCERDSRRWAQCDSCGRYTGRYQQYHVDGDEICYRCVNEQYRSCVECDAYVRIGQRCDCGFDDDNGDRDPCECLMCEEARGSSSYGDIHNYSYRPNLNFRGEGKIFYGMEIEVTTGPRRRDSLRQRLADDVQAAFGSLVYLKEDASISHGFEIVTHPMSYAWANENFPWDRWSHLETGGLGADDTTGIHIHVSRAGFSGASHTYRWLQFFYRNADPIQAIARRRDAYYGAFKSSQRPAHKFVAKGEPVRCGACVHCTEYASYGYPCRRYVLERYAAINLTNETTFEVRIFQSSVNADEIRAALGLVAASVEYTRTLSAHDVLHSDGWSWPAFVQWVSEHPEYTPLSKEIERLCA